MLPTGKLSLLRLQQELQEVLDCQQRLRRFSEEIILIMAESLARRTRAESEDVSRDAVIGRRGRACEPTTAPASCPSRRPVWRTCVCKL